MMAMTQNIQTDAIASHRLSRNGKAKTQWNTDLPERYRNSRSESSSVRCGRSTGAEVRGIRGGRSFPDCFAEERGIRGGRSVKVFSWHGDIIPEQLSTT